eukprot:symbB.v1.2.000077.t1/scaffold14.1/size489596/2
MDTQARPSLGNILDEKFLELQDRLKSCEAQLRRSEVNAEASSEELKIIKETLAGKANAEELAARMEDLAQAVQRKAESTDVAHKSQVEAVKKILHLKADRNEVPTKDAVQILQDSMSQSRQEVEDLKKKVVDFEELSASQLQYLQQSLESKAERAAVPSLAFFEFKMQEQADAAAVATNDNYQAVLKMLESKADLDKVPKITDVQVLEEQMKECLTLKSQLEALHALVLKKEAELQSLQREVQHKASVGEVATALEVKLLNGKLQDKANTKDVVTLSQHNVLAKMLENKADSWDVPSLVEFRGVDQLLRQQGEATQELRRQIESKANAAETVKKDDFNSLEKEVKEKADSKDVPNKQEFDALKEAMDSKAEKSGAVTTEHLQSLAKDVPSRASIIVLNNALHGKANLNETATKEELQALASAIKGKADVTSVPNWKDFHHLRDRVQRKADREAVPSMAQFQTLNTTLAKVAEGESLAPALKRRRCSPDARRGSSPGTAPSTPGRLMPATPAPQTPMPGTPAPPVATPRVASPERAAAAPETPKPAALTPFAPRKAAKGSKNETPDAEMQAVPVEPKDDKTAPTPKVAATPKPRGRPRKDAEAKTHERPHKKTPLVQAGPKKGKAMQWNKFKGTWEDPV